MYANIGMEWSYNRLFSKYGVLDFSSRENSPILELNYENGDKDIINIEDDEVIYHIANGSNQKIKKEISDEDAIELKAIATKIIKTLDELDE